jgi:hypothetical protein
MTPALFWSSPAANAEAINDFDREGVTASRIFGVHW